MAAAKGECVGGHQSVHSQLRQLGLVEQFGQLRIFTACVLIFTVGSLLCALAPNVYFLIGFRVIQAIGGGGVFPAATGLIAQKFPQTRARMIGLFASKSRRTMREPVMTTSSI